MSDLRTVWNPDGGFGDLLLSGPSLGADRDLDTAIVISIFTDARARPDDVLPSAGASRRGWFGDGLLQVQGDGYGSRLWLLARAKQTAETLNRAREYVEEALAWMTEDGVAAQVQVTAEWTAMGVLGLLVRATRPDGGTIERRFDYAWDQVGAA